MNEFSSKLFTQLPWRIEDVSVLDIATDFLDDDDITGCDFWKGVDHGKNLAEPSIPISLEKKIEIPHDKCKKRKLHYPQLSTLTRSQHHSALKALQLLQSKKNPMSYSSDEQILLNLYKFLSAKINAENSLFLQFAENNWNEYNHKRKTLLHSKLYNYSMERWKRDISNVKQFHQFYQFHKMISIADGKHCVKANRHSDVIEMGYVSKIDLPSIKNKKKMTYDQFKLQYEKKTALDFLEESRKPVSSDKNALILAEKYQPDIVISSSGLKMLLDNYGPNYNNFWNIPVRVKCLRDKEVAFIDKPLPKRSPTLTDFNYKCKKQLLKNTFCQKYAFSFNTEKITEILGYEIKTKSTNLKKKSKTNKQNLNTNQNEPAVSNLNDNASSDDSFKIIKIDLCSDSSSQETNQLHIEQNLEIKKPKKSGKSTNLKEYRNVSYRLWILKNDEQNALLKNRESSVEIKILVRCKIDGCEEVENNIHRGIILLPKVEHQWEYGSETMTKSETLRQWATLYFRPNAQLVRMHVPSKNNFIITYQRFNIESLSDELSCSHNLPPSGRLVILHRILAQICQLDIGDYLLHHEPSQGAFVAIMKTAQHTNDAEKLFDLHKLYSEENCKVKEDTTWLPINKSLILPFHITRNVFPAMFPTKYLSEKDKQIERRRALSQSLKKKKKQKPQKKNVIIENAE